MQVLTAIRSQALFPLQCWIDYWISSPSYLTQIARTIGCHEGALRLVTSLIVAYPLGLIYNLFLTNCSVKVKHMFFLVSGISLGLFNYGVNILHTLSTIVTVYLVMRMFRGNLTSVVISFIFCTVYLLWGYYLTLSDEYAFEWTIPQCVLTLRLIAVAFDVYDGTQVVRHSNGKHKDNNDRNDPSISKSSLDTTKWRGEKETASNDEKLNDVLKPSHWNEDALLKIPSPLELLAHCYFPSAFLVGPQYGLKQYLDLVMRKSSLLHKSKKAAIDRLYLGIIYMIVYQVTSEFLPPKLLLSHGFKEGAFLKKLLIVTLVTKTQLCKYICIWLISEGSSILSGVTYDVNSDSFDKNTNVRIYEYETTTTFGGLIHSFNVTTNQWAGKYIFKRLKFLNSKFLSHMGTLLYLALWHGWKSGYYVTFTIEFLIMKTEREVLAFINEKRAQNKALDSFFNLHFVHWTIKIFFRIYTLVIFGYCLVPFILLTSTRYLAVLQDLHFYGHCIYIPAAMLAPLLLTKLKKKKHASSIRS